MKVLVYYGLLNTMNTNLARRELLYFFIHRNHGKHSHLGLGLAISQVRKTKFEIKNILRWEDDGGQLSGWRNQTLSDTFGNAKSEKQAYKDEYLVNDSPGG